jgi:hypothetical protein
MRLELLRNGNLARVIAENVSNTGHFTWTVPNDVPPRKGYSIRITNENDTTFTDVTDGTFRVVVP